MQVVIPRQEALLTTPDPNRRLFRGLSEFRDLIAQQEDVEEAPATVAGHDMPRHKGLVWADTGLPITIVGSRFKPFLHRLALGRIADTLESRGMEPTGYLTMTDAGHLHVKLHFPNPTFLLDLRLRSRDPDDLMYLGLSFENSYGEPACAFSTEAMGLNPNHGHHALLGSILGSTRIPHYGDIEERVLAALSRLTLDAQLLANTVQAADAYEFHDHEAANLALRGAGYGPRLATTVLEGGKQTAALPESITAWQLFNAVTRFLCAQQISEAGRDEHLGKAQALLHPTRITALLRKGQRIIEEEAAEEEVAFTASEEATAAAA
jgi:hypothetical protein